MDIEIRTPSPDELESVVEAADASWGYHATEEEFEDARTLAELDRAFVAFDRGRPVGVAAAMSFDLTLPGGATVAAGGLSEVGVVPTHRRRGVLTALMAHHLDDCRDRGEPFSLLVASEGTIYPRFGYGPATLAMAVEIDRRRAAFAPHAPDPPGGLRLLGPEETALLVPEAYDRYRRAQPGEVSRSEAYWQFWLRDRERWRDGASARFVVAHEAPDGDIGGYVSYRMRAAWPQGLPAFNLDVEELVAADPAVRAALWRYVLGVDLVGTISVWNVPLDEPLRWLLADPRALRVTAVRDLLWANLTDIGAALAARAYAASDRLTIEVSDEERRYVLEGGPDGASCRPAATTTPPDLSLKAADLAIAYLGATTFSTLARAGRVVEYAARALARADALFSCDPPAHSVTDF
ncbi:MAG: GNAT family N-acetyltransferase [Acidimicrobiales bacterium]